MIMQLAAVIAAPPTQGRICIFTRSPERIELYGAEGSSGNRDTALGSRSDVMSSYRSRGPRIGSDLRPEP